MKKVILRALTAAFILSACTPNEGPSAGYPITPTPFTSVKVEANSFWGQRLEASRKVTIPLAFSKCESEGRYTNFSNAAERMKDSTKFFKVHGRGFSFDDTDPYKTIEGASYILQTYPDERLKLYIDSVLAVIASAQEPDGYLYTARTQNPEEPHHWAGPTRWSKVEDLSHEFYNLGHMAESAVAHYQATGERTFLDIATRYADCIIREVGDQPGQACVVPGHQIAEMALCKLYLVTGERKYLDQAKFFLDYRGKTSFKTEYSQSHKPVVEQDETDGGQRGLRSIITHLNTDAFPRIRLGAGQKPEKYDMSDWVLSKFTADEQKALFSCLECAADALPLIFNGDVDGAMSRFNGTGKNG